MLFRAGGPYAEVGARLRDGHTDDVAWITLEPKKVRGIMSEGMVCSAKELGLGEDHEGILILDKVLTVGQLLADALGDPVPVPALQPNSPADRRGGEGWRGRWGLGVGRWAGECAPRKRRPAPLG